MISSFLFILSYFLCCLPIHLRIPHKTRVGVQITVGKQALCRGAELGEGCGFAQTAAVGFGIGKEDDPVGEQLLHAEQHMAFTRQARNGILAQCFLKGIDTLLIGRRNGFARKIRASLGKEHRV